MIYGGITPLFQNYCFTAITNSAVKIYIVIIALFNKHDTTGQTLNAIV